MAGYLVRRVIWAVITLWAISMVAFAIVQLPPGDFITGMYRQQGASVIEPTQLEIDTLRERWGLNKPWIVQYATWMSRVFRGDFGFSAEWNSPVRQLIAERWILTALVAGSAILFTFIVAIPVGIYSAVRQYSIGDHFFTFFGFLGLAIPNFLLALLLMVLAIIWFDWSVTGLFSPEYIVAPWSFDRIWDLLKHLWIPGLVLGTAGTAALMRILRANLLDELNKPYVVTARAKGLPEYRVILKYPVRVALNPVISGMAFLLPQVFSGAVIVSVVLNLPTMGPLLLSSLKNQDTMVGGSIILILGALTILGMLISDILLTIVDPRIRLTRSE